jgi:CubicO group peptidase (beta-lactamase class C family)
VAVDYSEQYEDPASHVQTQDRVAGWRTRVPGDPADTYQFLQGLRPNGNHGDRFRYVSAGTDVLAWVMERVTGLRYADVLSAELWAPLQQSREALITVDTGGFAFANGGIACTARDLARVGELMLREGTREGAEIVPASWVAETMSGGNREAAAGSIFQAIHPNGSYHNQWWITGDAHGSIYAAGIYGQFIWVDPTADVVIVKFSSWPEAIREEWSRSHSALFREIIAAISPS